MDHARFPRRCRPHWVRWAAGLLGASLAAVGCNRAPCGGLNPPTNDPNAPAIVSVELVKQDVINPWQFDVAINFTDRNGDVGSGNLDVYVGTSPAVNLSLAPYFASSELALDSRAGRLGIDINLASGSVQDDNIYRLGFQLRDALKNYSNCYTLDVHFDVDRLGALSPSRVRQVLCGARLASRSW